MNTLRQRYQALLAVLCVSVLILFVFHIYSGNHYQFLSDVEEPVRDDPLDIHVINPSAPRLVSDASPNLEIISATLRNSTGLENITLCPESGNKLVGPLAVTFEAPSYEQLATIHPELKPGGLFEPDFCIPRARVAIIVPYRNRDEQLRAFLHHMHPVLQRQLLKYEIFIVEQYGDSKFNRALLMNIGYNESIHLAEWDYFIFHDVDLFIEDDRAPYQCPSGPMHMSGYIDKVLKLLHFQNFSDFMFDFSLNTFCRILEFLVVYHAFQSFISKWLMVILICMCL